MGKPVDHLLVKLCRRLARCAASRQILHGGRALPTAAPRCRLRIAPPSARYTLLPASSSSLFHSLPLTIYSSDRGSRWLVTVWTVLVVPGLLLATGLPPPSRLFSPLLPPIPPLVRLRPGGRIIYLTACRTSIVYRTSGLTNDIHDTRHLACQLPIFHF